VWPVSRACLLLLGTWSYLRICRRSVLPCTRFCNCFFDYGYVLHIVNFDILYYKRHVWEQRFTWKMYQIPDLVWAPPFVTMATYSNTFELFSRRKGPKCCYLIRILTKLNQPSKLWRVYVWNGRLPGSWAIQNDFTGCYTCNLLLTDSILIPLVQTYCTSFTKSDPYQE
jgi:hypothetical protein